MRFNMLTSITDGIMCCITGRALNVVGAIDSVESSDGYDYIEVKPGRILRVKHIVPGRSPAEQQEESVVAEEGGEGEEMSGKGVVHCKRKISVYRNGQVVIENLGDVIRSEILHCQNGNTEPGSTVEIELSDANVASPRANGTIQEQGTVKRRKRKPKKTVVIDCKKRITSCKGSHSDVALFFIHGVGGSLDIWKEQLDFFGKLGYEVVAPDLAGHGSSTAPKIGAAYTFYALAEDMRAIFRRYGKKRNILIGHSYGVSFCTFLAHEYPDQVHKVVMINGGGPTALEPSLCSIFNLPTCVLHCLSPCLAWSFLKAAFARQGAKEKQLLKEGNAFKVTSFVLQAMMSGQYWPEGDEVYHAELTVPVLLVHGMHDKFVPVDEDQRMAEILLIAFLKVIDEGSHMVMMECPETVNTLLHEFLLWEPEITATEQVEAKQTTENK
ncbi:protein ABHD8 [Chiloscyllium plagiosum]|uniref:protein ABHD8 n=1 Tax=Chiloscyllium plagiosum TaxID=36176 RepID=UPI001CB8329C|nr:protein ABHD8 [Chiloscyllium plagiosum]